MKTKWNYSKLAKAYIKRPSYAPQVIEDICKIARIDKESTICDIGAGVAHLTLELAKRECSVIAIEPNNEMRKIGIDRTFHLPNVKWVEASAENTRQSEHCFDAITFGSSFNVCEREIALLEGRRITKNNGWFVCLWNHRDIKDPIQAEIESIIKNDIPDYQYGSRREDQTNLLKASSLFQNIQKISGTVHHKQNLHDCIEAWKSHATLERQAKESFPKIISEIDSFLRRKVSKEIIIPYTTQCWIAQFKKN